MANVTRWNSLQNLDAKSSRRRCIVTTPIKVNARQKMVTKFNTSMFDEKVDNETWGGKPSSGGILINLCPRLERKTVDIYLTPSRSCVIKNGMNMRNRGVNEDSSSMSNHLDFNSLTPESVKSSSNCSIALSLLENRSIFHDDEQNPIDLFRKHVSNREKKVTFALENCSKEKLTAEEKRLRFRKRSSKSKINSRVSLTPSNADSRNSVFHDMTNSDDIFAPLTIGTPIGDDANNNIENENPLEVDVTDPFLRTNNNCSPPSLMISTKHQELNTDRNSSNVLEKSKRMIVKRKLKSCRSRSFHKSLNFSEYDSVAATYSYTKPLKAIHPDVVTMVSLVNSDNSEIQITKTDVNAPSTKIKTEIDALSNGGAVEVANRYKSTSDFEEKCKRNGICLSTTKNFNLHSTYKTVASTISNISSAQIPNFKESSKHLLKRESATCFRDTLELDENNKCSINSDNDSQWQYQRSATFTSKTTTINNSALINDIDTILRRRKEKECWSTFQKMSNHGMFVSFDTILRGLLTPTEYRLRRNEFLMQ